MESLDQSRLVAALLLVQLGSLLDVVIKEVLELGVLVLQLLVVPPSVHLVEHVAFAVLERILTVEAALSLTGPSYGLVIKRQNGEAAGKWSRRIDEVPEINLREGLHKLIDIIRARVIALDLTVREHIADGIVLIFPVTIHREATSQDVKGDLTVVIDDLAASFDSRDEVGVPNGATVHADDTTLVVGPLLRWEHSRNGA